VDVVNRIGACSLQVQRIKVDFAVKRIMITVVAPATRQFGNFEIATIEAERCTDESVGSKRIVEAERKTFTRA
jgi:hypothetical protein